jgi:3-phosphoshikimate 1-carboxyvinyltransferase
MSIEVLRELGIRVDVDVTDHMQAKWTVHPGIPQSFNVTVEPDLSNAAPFLAAALVCGGCVTIPDWPEVTTQPGDFLRELLPRMGGSVSRVGSQLSVTGTGEISGIDVDLHEVGELTPVIAALCALAHSPSKLRGIAHLRGHETDRLAALASEINNLGGSVTEGPGELLIKPTQMKSSQIFKSYEDHRMATAGAIIGLAVEGITVENIETTRKTLSDFPGMWQAMLDG